MSIKNSYAQPLSVILLIVSLWPTVTAYSQQGQEGIASFYHERFNGRRTASGEIFNNNSFTCAHRTLPLGTKVEITNLSNGKFVVATVNDRGPYNRSRVIDVTRRVAQELDFHKQGITKVKIKILDHDIVDPTTVYTDCFANDSVTNAYKVKLGVYECRDKVRELTRQLLDSFGVHVFIKQQQMVEGVTYQVYAGCFKDMNAAEQLLKTLYEDFPEAKIEASINAK